MSQDSKSIIQIHRTGSLSGMPNCELPISVRMLVHKVFHYDSIITQYSDSHSNQMR